jgi:predicted ATP-dependent endonuclease of OLD family
LKIESVSIHNFRSISDSTLNIQDYSILLGANNVGKTNFLSALRVFYEDGIKFESSNDFPKFSVSDDESWIEIKYKLANDEFALLKEEYREGNNSFRVRKYLKSSKKELVQTGQSNIFGYEKGKLSQNLFYGAKNISQAKLGKVLYIPEIAQTSETIKFSGPSPLRDMMNFVVKKVVEKSISFQQLTESFKDFNKKFQAEESKDGLSLESLIGKINDELTDWKMKFGININSLEPEDIVKNLVTHYLIDLRLSQEVSVKNTGQGMQRHLIFTLLRLSLDYVDKKKSKSEFSPDLTLLLFEEPEAFLHPCQQECLNRTLEELSKEYSQQVIVSTHSPIFVSKNIENLPSLIRLNKAENGQSIAYQIAKESTKLLIEENAELTAFLKSKLSDPTISQGVKDKIGARLDNTTEERRMEEEAMRYALWLDPTRCSAFFADKVLICEGATERIFIEYLIENKWTNLCNKRACILDAMGKYNVHRYMNLFKQLGIRHSVLIDKDLGGSAEYCLNDFINSSSNGFTEKIDCLQDDLESFLGIQPPAKNSTDKKPLNVMWQYNKGKIDNERIENLKKKVEGLLP